MFDHSQELAVVENSRSNSSWASLTVIIICLVAWAGLLPSTFSHNSWVYSWDSAAYIETAQSFLAGQGLRHRVIMGLGRDLCEPISLWPPGYSVLIAVAQTIGLPAVRGCAVVSGIAAAMSVTVMAWIFLRFFHWIVALPLTLTTVIMPSFLQISTQCLSDSSYFAFTLASVACLVEWTIRPQASLLWVFGAGLFAGASWVTRYSGVALFAATGVLLLLHLFWFRFGDSIKVWLVWLLGVVVCSVPLVIRNLVTFGQINPYSMPPSDLSLWVNIRQAIRVIVEDMTASIVNVIWIVDKNKFPIYGLILIALLGFWSWRMSWPRIREVFQRQGILVFLVAYLLIYTAMVISARTQFRWGEEISSRYMVQTYWIVWACAVSWLASGLRVAGISPKLRTGIVVIGLCAMALLQLDRQLELIGRPADRPDSVESKIGGPAVAFLAQEVEKDQIVLATRADLLRIHADINARKLPPVSQSDFLQLLTREDVKRLGQSGFLWGLVVEDVDGAKRGDYDAFVKDLVEKPEHFPELERVKIASPASIFRYNRTVSGSDGGS